MQEREVWSRTLDDHYRCNVTRRSDPYQGRLVVTDDRNGAVLLSEDVMISADGPDEQDVSLWMRRCRKATDAR